MALQHSLIKLLNVGVLSANAPATPSATVAAAMVCRLNSSCRGHSAIRKSVLDRMATMLSKRLLPVVPLRGSISASGDLIPFSYIASAMAGLATSLIEHPKPDLPPGNITAAGRARPVLRDNGLEPVVFQEKEVLALINGTHFSVASAALALFDANQLAVAAQVLTALTVEALGGSLESFDNFTLRVRPHPGQAKSAASLRRLLEKSERVSEARVKDHSTGLRQDRYATRTAPQWIGPQLEALIQATQAVTIELNSTTDNPLFDIDGARAVHGGNFQESHSASKAMAVTNAMESTRLALCHLGKILFAQHTELVNVKTNNGLPPNLCWNEPSTDFGFKGVEISMASYMSELAYLSSPVSTHVQTAELGNQAVNSLAYLSARYTAESCHLLKLMVAAHLYALYQATHLRDLLDRFLAHLPAILSDAYDLTLAHACTPVHLASFLDRLTSAVTADFLANASLDTLPRCQSSLAQAADLFLDSRAFEIAPETSAASFAARLKAFKEAASKRMSDRWLDLQRSGRDSPSDFLRRLGQTDGVIRHLQTDMSLALWVNGDEDMVGDRLAQVYDAMSEGHLYDCFHSCFP